MQSNTAIMPARTIDNAPSLETGPRSDLAE
jgi:hypothetical protein